MKQLKKLKVFGLMAMLISMVIMASSCSDDDTGGRALSYGKVTGVVTDDLSSPRTHNVPFLGLCLGMQLSIVEFARNVIGYKDAHSMELNPDTTHPVIHIMSDQIGIEDIGGTLRLGSYPCVLKDNSLAYKLYGKKEIEERHRHRYEVNNDYREVLEENGMSLCGLSPDSRIVEMVEIPSHPWFIATQAHPELKSRPNRPHPLFKGFVEAALENQKEKNK